MKTFVDIVLMSIKDGELVVLNIKRNRENEPFFGEWALPGGYVPDHVESLEEAAVMTLNRELGINSDFYLEQLYTFGPSGDPRWRRISISFICLVDYKTVSDKWTQDASEIKWMKAKDINYLAFDHMKILKKGIKRIQNKIRYSSIGFYFIGEEFTLKDVIDTFESVLEIKIDPSNFRKKLLSLGVIETTNKQIKQDSGKGRPSPIYRLNLNNLNALKNDESLI